MITYEIQGSMRLSLLVGLLSEKEQTLSGLTCPSRDWVCNLWLLRAKVVAHVLGGDGTVTKPDVSLGEFEFAPNVIEKLVSFKHATSTTTGQESLHHRARILVSKCTIVEGTSMVGRFLRSLCSRV